MNMGKRSNQYLRHSFMQGGRPIDVEECLVTILEDGTVSDSGRELDGRWVAQDSGLTIQWNDGSEERYCRYSRDVTSAYTEHLFTYGKVLTPQTIDIDLAVTPIDDNPREPMNEHLRAVHKGCRRILSRASSDFFDLFPSGGRFLEVGVGYGNNALRIHANLNPSELHLLDCWRMLDGTSDDYSQENLDDAFNSTRAKFAGDSRVVFHRGMSHELLGSLPPGYFDMIYVDANHMEEPCYEDLMLCEPLLRPSGYLCGHDYTEYPNREDDAVTRGNYGVTRAVDRFCRDRDWQMDYLTIEVEDWCFPSYVLSKKSA